MRYLSVCSGIEAATVAWRPLGWEAAAFAEIAPFPSAVLAHHYPEVPNVGDFTEIKGNEFGPIDLLVGGTPCTAFSIAGKRAGFDDARGHLTLEFIRLIGRVRPRWFVWENVPGGLSLDGGRTFGTIVGQMAELGYGLAWRVFDAQYFGVPQRRRRVFVVGYSGDGAGAAAILFEPHSLSGSAPPGGRPPHPRAGALARTTDDTERGLPLHCPAIAPTVVTGAPFAHTGTRRVETNARIISPTIRSETGQAGLCLDRDALIGDTLGVRRLTPRECERLQGFPDDYTSILYKGAPALDTPRYAAIGNSMAIPVMRWIGARIDHLEKILGRDT